MFINDATCIKEPMALAQRRRNKLSGLSVRPLASQLRSLRFARSCSLCFSIEAKRKHWCPSLVPRSTHANPMLLFPPRVRIPVASSFCFYPRVGFKIFFCTIPHTRDKTLSRCLSCYLSASGSGIRESKIGAQTLVAVKVAASPSCPNSQGLPDSGRPCAAPENLAFH